MIRNIISYSFTLLICFSSHILWAQNQQDKQSQQETQQDEIQDNNEIQAVEKELEKNLPAEVIIPQDVSPNAFRKIPTVDFQKSSEFTQENTYLASIQRTFMPKKSRFLKKFQLVLNTSDAFFNSYGLSAQGTWHWNELFGFNLEAFYLSAEKGQTAKDLESVQRVGLTNLISLNGGYSANLAIYPIYGKLAFMNRMIVPFNLFFRLGLGKLTTTTSGEVSSTNIGSGLLIALDRSQNLRMDLNLFLYQARDSLGVMGSQTTLMVSVGYGWFFPEPEYR